MEGEGWYLQALLAVFHGGLGLDWAVENFLYASDHGLWCHGQAFEG